MNLNEMSTDQLKDRLEEIRSQADQLEPEAGELTEERVKAAEELSNERSSIEAELEIRRQKAEEEQRARDDVASGKDGESVEKMNNMEERKMYNTNSPEYRNAFLQTLKGVPQENWTEEERAAYVATTGDNTHGAALLLPTQMLNNIWSLIEEQHSILGDITMYRTNTIMTIPVHSSVSQGDAAAISENTAATDEINEWTTVTLHGVDYSKTVKITYAMAAMSIDALENYLTNEIAARLGAAMAKDTVTGILSNYYTTDATFTAYNSALTFPTVAKAFGALKNPNGQAAVYANNKTLYTYLVGMVDTAGRPIYQHDANEGAQGSLIGYPVKVEDALSDDIILVGYPKNVVGNVVQDVMVETDRDISKHVIIYSGYARYESALAAPKSFAKITVTSATEG